MSSRKVRRALLPALLWALLLPFSTAPGAAAQAAREIVMAADVTGLWSGQVLYAPAMVEIDFVVELATGPDGELVGNIDIPSQRMKLHPLDTVRQEGDALHFTFDRFPNREDLDAIFTFEGKLEGEAEASGRFAGVTEQGPVEAGFRMERIGEVGAERPQPVYSDLHDLDAELQNLKASFNQDKGKVRVLSLLSPTCGVCRISASIIQRYVLDQVAGERLAMFTVWGPMLGDETREAAVDATSTMPDPRVGHYWTESAFIAERFRPVTGLEEGDLAWDTFLLYPPDATWGEAVPEPALVFQVNKPLPEKTRLHGDRLREQVQRLLPGD